MSIHKCYLENVKTKDKIIIKDMKLNCFGRNKETKINDLRISKKHLYLRANYKTGELHVKVVGKIAPVINGLKCKSDRCYKVGHGTILQLIPTDIIYEVFFEPTPNTNLNNVKFCDFHAKQESIDHDMNVESTICEESKWLSIENQKLLIFSSKNLEAKSLIGGFDLDGTIITTSSGARFPKNPDDWKILHNIKKIKDLYSNGYKIVLFTNQAGLGMDKKKISDFKMKIEKIIKVYDVPMQVFISTTRSIYRKPSMKMWDILEKDYNNNVRINLEESFYVGDAAGRPDKWQPGKKKDFSSSDRLFALNIGLRFYTPEEYFLNQSPAKFNMPEFDPRNLSSTSSNQYENISSDKQEIVVMVGVQGSGKSSFSKNYLVSKGYEQISNDKYRSFNKCTQVMEKAIAARKSVVVDNTNPDEDSRQQFIHIAKKHGLPIRCFVMKTSLDHAQHNLKFRYYSDESIPPIPDMAFNIYKKKFKMPELSEGFDDVIEIEFIPIFVSSDDETAYKKFLI